MVASSFYLVPLALESRRGSFDDADMERVLLACCVCVVVVSGGASVFVSAGCSRWAYFSPLGKVSWPSITMNKEIKFIC
jgi:hypothetical protein